MKKVYIDLGHGGKDSGTVGVNNILEKDIVLSIGKKLVQKLKKCNVEVKMSRTDDTTKTLQYRSSEANKWGADCFVSLHCNSFNKLSKGIETYCYKFKYRKLADDIHEELIKAHLYTQNRGVKEGNFHVLRETKMPATLIELAFIDNIEDIDILLNKQNEFATAIAKGICKFLCIEYNYDDNSNKSQLWAVCVGAFKERENADRVLHEAKNKGFKDAYIIPR